MQWHEHCIGLGKLRLHQGICHGCGFIQGGSRVSIIEDQVHRLLIIKGTYVLCWISLWNMILILSHVLVFVREGSTRRLERSQVLFDREFP